MLKNKIAIIGMGYVGVPLSLLFAKKKFQLQCYEIDKQKLKNLRIGKSYINHIKDKDFSYLRKSKTEFYNKINKNISKNDFIIICVPTPVKSNLKPDLRYIKTTSELIAKYLVKNQIVILESSTYPGTTDEVLVKILNKSGLIYNKDYFVAYSPEREDPGNKKFTTSKITKVVGCDNKKISNIVQSLYKNIVKNTFKVSNNRTAEAVKLTENIFRSTNIALINELKIIFKKLDINIWEVIEAAATKPFGYMKFEPGPGLGGHCIPVDPFYLIYKAKETGINPNIIELCSKFNNWMPDYTSKEIIKILNRNIKKNTKKILILGIAYKKNIDDIREAPALKIMNNLIKKNIIVDYNDEYVKIIPNLRKYPNFKSKKSVSLTKKNLIKYDAVICITDHTYYDKNKIFKFSKLIIDAKNFFKNKKKKIIKI